MDKPASSWLGSDFPDLAALHFTLTPAHLDAIDTLMAMHEASGRRFDEMRHEDFSHPALDADLAALRETVMHGRGFVLLSGLPVDRYDEAGLEAIFWGIGTHFGQGHSQSAAGDRMGHVRDVTAALKGRQSGRGYLSRRTLSPHTDLTEILGMMTVRQAAEGGESVYASANRIYEIVAAEHPEFIPVYEKGFPYHRRGEEADGAEPITPYDVPIYSSVSGVRSCFYVRDIIDVAMRDLGRDYTPLERAALDFLEEVFARDEVKIEMILAPGTAIIMNNYEVLHGRRTFTDHGDEARKRLIYRLQMETGSRPLHPDIFIYRNRDGGHGIDQQAGKGAAAPDFLVENA